MSGSFTPCQVWWLARQTADGHRRWRRMTSAKTRRAMSSRRRRQQLPQRQASEAETRCPSSKPDLQLPSSKLIISKHRLTTSELATPAWQPLGMEARHETPICHYCYQQCSMIQQIQTRNRKNNKTKVCNPKLWLHTLSFIRTFLFFKLSNCFKKNTAHLP